MQAVERQMPKFSRSRLVDMLKGLVQLGVRLSLVSGSIRGMPTIGGEGGCGGENGTSSGDEDVQSRAESPRQCDDDFDEAWLHAYLRSDCFRGSLDEPRAA